MASGILGTPADLTPLTYTVLYTVPADTFTVASVSIINRGSVPLNIRLAASDTSVPTNAEFLEYDTTIAAKSMLERTGIVLQAGKNIVVYADATSCNSIAFGIETAA